MSGRIVEHNGIADAKRKEAYIAHRNMLVGRALQMKLNEDKAERNKHQRSDLRVVKKGDYDNE